jgi:hypothetical protein
MERDAGAMNVGQVKRRKERINKHTDSAELLDFTVTRLQLRYDALYLLAVVRFQAPPYSH